MSKSLLEQLPEIVRAGKRQAERIMEGLEARNAARVIRLGAVDQIAEAGRKSPESGTLGGAQSFGVTESATVSPKVCAPGDESTNQIHQKKSPLNEPDRVAAMMNKKLVPLVHA